MLGNHLPEIARVEDERAFEGHPRASVRAILAPQVPAFQRVSILAEVVTRLASQTYPKDRYEVIVVDDGSADDITPFIEGMPEHLTCQGWR